MVRTTSPDSDAYLDTSSSAKQSKSTSDSTMTDQIQSVKNYFSILDGSPDGAKRFPAAFRETFHRDAVIEYPGGKLSYEGAIATFQSVLNQGGYPDLEEISDNGNGTVTMIINNHVPGSQRDDVTRQIVYFKEGKIIRVHAVDPDSEQFGGMIKQCVAIATKEITEKHLTMLAYFDGSPDAYARAEPIIDEIFDEDLVIEYGEGQVMDFDSFKAWAATFSNDKNVAKLEEIESHENEIRLTVRNIIDGVDQGPVEQVGIVRNGKIVHWRAAPANEAGFERLISSVASSTKQSLSLSNNNSNMSEQIQRIKNYCATLDGSPDAAKRFPAAFRDTFHHDCVIEYPGGNLFYYDAITVLQHVVDKGGYPDLENIFDNGDGTATMIVNNHIPEGPWDDVTQQIAHFKDGKLVRVRAVALDKDQFGGVIKRCMSISTKNVAQKYSTMLACFDGSPDAYTKAESIIDEIFDKDLVIHYGEDKLLNLDLFKAWAATFSHKRNVAKLEDIETNEKEILVKIRNVVDGIDQGPVAQVGVVRNGKIVHWAAASENEAGFNKLISSVAAQPERMMLNIQRLREYLAAIDGSPDAWGRVEPFFNRVYASDLVWDNENGSEMCHDEIVAFLRDKYIPNGCYPVIESIVDNRDGTVIATVKSVLPGIERDATNPVVLYYGEDDLVHRISSSPLYEMCQRVNALPLATGARSETTLN